MKYILCLFIFLLSCQNKSEEKESLKYLDDEISQRMKTLETLVLKSDSMKTKSILINEEVNNLILLSKDIENLSACVNRSNSFFDAVAAEFRLNLKDFTKLHTDMHVMEIEMILKQNELNLFNQIIFKVNPNASGMYTAH